jgi:threonine aldolase
MPIDLRSDTVTRPTKGMLQSMSEAKVGDDVWGDDPTVLRLQAITAERANQEAGLFFPTGTMSNLAAVMAHCERGDEYLCGQYAHTYRWEGGGAAVLGSVVPQPLEHEADGSIALNRIEAAIKPHGPGLGAHYARTRLLTLENTIGGRVLESSYVDAAIALARRRGLGLHLDGARIANAAVAQGAQLATLAAGFDTVSICFSKGLGAPVGSVLVGSKELIAKAYRWRKVLGGGMRQAGYLAAACIYALDHHWARLGDDHANAASLAAGLAGIEGVEVLRQSTNMVFVRFPAVSRVALQAELARQGMLTDTQGDARLVTHLDITREDIDVFVAAVQRFLA